MDGDNILSDEKIIERAVKAVELDIEKKRVLDAPIYVYDRNDKTVYQVKKDGTRIPVAKKLRKGSYCEQCGQKT